MGSVGAKKLNGGTPIPTPQPITPTKLSGTATPEEVKSFYKNNFNIDIPDKDLNSLSRFTLVESGNSLLDFFQMLPNDMQQALRDVNYSIEAKNLGSNTYAQVSNWANSIMLNTKLFGKGKHDILRSSYESDVSSHWHPANTDYSDILVHEMGHKIEWEMTKKLVGGGTFDSAIAWNDSVYTKQILDAAYNDWKSSGSMPKGTTKSGARESVSRYADAKSHNKTLYHETIAEALCDYAKNGNNATPYSIHIWNNFKQLFS